MIREVIKKGKNVLDKRLIKVCFKSRGLATLYYTFFNSSFKREHQAVLSGKVKHLEESQVNRGNYFLLTRNIHRIEKGLLMRPRRPVFAREYIAETIDSFEQIWEPEVVETNPQMKWFYDVLENYFDACNSDDVVDLQRSRFIEIIKSRAHSNHTDSSVKSSSVPYHRLEEDRSTIAYEEFYKLTKQRRSVRWFLDKKVPRELVDKAILAGNQSPSACNRQPYEFRVFDDPNLVSELVQLPMGTKGYANNVPMMIALVGNLDAYFDERDRHIIYIDASLAAMSFMLALETLGLSSCAINWPDIEVREKKMDRFLGLEQHQRTIMCLAVGYPDPEGKVAYSEKRPLSLLRKYNYEN
ncbi:nitroreductase family protein [Echinicola rosea]|uniref:Nitroreductase domain-containing protein n=1 Tax=Echinicola rosea TaxID=1807691 RepID=A0ABQ1VBQ8_9BACT|nr:nitroreductase family protein [Echinicola rosea]GGF51611.1 hypothetical protein GCM10011339_45180 [Echinicola rosea]